MIAELVLIVRAPLTGLALPLADVPDPVFAQGMVGEGMAINPTLGEVRAPVDGRVEVLVPTGHALAMRTAEGVEVLIHVGVETVKLPDLFTAHVAAGDEVRAGDLLLSFDLEGVRSRAASPLSPVVITALPEGLALQVAPTGGSVRAGEDAVLLIGREEAGTLG